MWSSVHVPRSSYVNADSLAAFAHPALPQLRKQPCCACWGVMSVEPPPYGEKNEDGMRMVLLQARTRKLEAESKLAGLQKDLAELGSVSGDQAGAEEAQTMQLHQVCFLLQCHDCIIIFMNSYTTCPLCSSCILAFLVWCCTKGI